MKALIEWFLGPVFAKKPEPMKWYVVLYDEPNSCSEEYYGYFSSISELLATWKIFASDGKKYENVKIATIVRDIREEEYVS
jgi:hypothetical protein